MKKYKLYEKAWKNKEAWKVANENWTLLHEIVDLRDGHKCVLCGRIQNLQLDHAITRSRKSVFMEPDNLNWLCPKCHTAKSFNPTNIESKRVDEITRQRIGKSKYDDLLRRAGILCPQFRTLAWQEGINYELKEYRSLLLAVEDIRDWK